MDDTGAIRNFNTPDGVHLCYRYWPGRLRVVDRKIACIYLHGATTHSEWISDIARDLSASGVTTFGLDRRGSGLNRAHAFDALKFKLDVAHFVKQARLKYDEVHLLGLCHGAVTFLHGILKESVQVDSLVVINPLFRPKRRTPANVARLGYCLLTDKPFGMRLKPRDFTHNEPFQQYIEQDPLRLPAVDPRFWTDVLAMSGDIFRDGGALASVPMIGFLGEANDFISLGRAFEFFEQWKPEATVKVYPAGKHILFFDEPVQFARDLRSWILDARR